MLFNLTVVLLFSQSQLPFFLGGQILLVACSSRNQKRIGCCIVFTLYLLIPDYRQICSAHLHLVRFFSLGFVTARIEVQRVHAVVALAAGQADSSMEAEGKRAWQVKEVYLGHWPLQAQSHGPWESLLWAAACFGFRALFHSTFGFISFKVGLCSLGITKWKKRNAPGTNIAASNVVGQILDGFIDHNLPI